MSLGTTSQGHTGDHRRILDRHRASWDWSEVDEPLVRVTKYSPEEPVTSLPLADGSDAQDGDLVTPDAISVDRIVATQETFSDAVDGDFLRGVEPYDLCWTEVLAGCGMRDALADGESLGRAVSGGNVES
jgi:hypothetical protein